MLASQLPYADRFEGFYLPLDIARGGGGGVDMFPYSHQQDGLHLEPIRLDWSLQRQTLWQHGVALHGPPPHALVDPVPSDELRCVVRNKLLGDWSSGLNGPEPEWLRTREYQAFAILTMCRALYTLENGLMSSKPVAARWASVTLTPPWPALIAQALVWRHDRHAGLRAFHSDTLPALWRSWRVLVMTPVVEHRQRPGNPDRRRRPND